MGSQPEGKKTLDLCSLWGKPLSFLQEQLADPHGSLQSCVFETRVPGEAKHIGLNQVSVCEVKVGAHTSTATSLHT